MPLLLRSFRGGMLPGRSHLPPFVHRAVLPLLVFTLGGGCSVPAAKTAFDVVVVFIKTLEILEEATELYKSHVSDAVRIARADLQPRDGRSSQVIDLQRAAIDWEESWQRVDAQTDELERRFSDVEKASERYWNTLERVTSAIKDPQLREQEVAKNIQVKQKWDAAYQNAKTKIAMARGLRDKGDDLRRMLIAAALRREIAEYTATLDSIAKEAGALLRALEDLVQQGRMVLNVEP